MKVLIACEESQRVCIEFRRLGHEAYSCDLQEPSGGFPQWHILGDALIALNGGEIMTMDGVYHYIDKWDLLIAHPPCTYLSAVTTRHLSLRCTSAKKIIERMWKLAAAAVFFMRFILADVEHICVENPSGFMSTLYRKPDQTIHPYYFAEDDKDSENYEHKRTCLWLKNLPPLRCNTKMKPPPPKYIGRNGKKYHFEETVKGNRAKNRSKTFSGIARAMAQQWGAIA